MPETQDSPAASDFVWGVSTSAYQIEGATTADGRVPGVWDDFAAVPGNVADDSTAEVACDHYHRFGEDIALARDLGVRGYRFSLSWPRIQPGPGQVNPAGLDFYDRLVDALHEAGLLPVATLFHWDTPRWLQAAGGWRRRDTVDRFAEFAHLVAERLGDRITLWGTLNEPFEHCLLGHFLGEHAPGLTLEVDEAMRVAHHLLLAHGRAVPILRAHAPVTLVNSYAPARPAGPGEADNSMAAFYDVLQNRLFTDPVLLGTYPEELVGLLPEDTVHDGDMATIAAPMDGLGVNYYAINAVRAEDDRRLLSVTAPQGYDRTAFGWAIAPEGLTETLTGLRQRYGDALPPLWITENGCAFDDEPGPDGTVKDTARIDYLEAHIAAMRTAMNQGVDVRGYFVWSLLDNWEWAEGYTKRFGLVHVDYDTQRRTPKASYDFYRAVLTTPGL